MGKGEIYCQLFDQIYPGKLQITKVSSKPTSEYEFINNFMLLQQGLSKIGVIKVVKNILGLGLKEAKELVDGAPQTIKEGVAKEEAESLQKQFADAGAKVELK